MSVPTKTLPSGDELPMIGFGTWELEGEIARESVQAALEAGYTHIDTAEGYMNEAELGEALAGADVDREDLFLTSKVLAKNLHYDDVIASCKASLEKLGTDYLDLYLIHWPNPAISVRETLHAMETLHEEGLVRNIGVSNFSAYQLSAAQHVSDVPIAVNQIEFHPWFQRPDLVEYCEDTDTVLEAAAPLGRTDVFEDEVVQELANEYEKSPAQIVLRWALERDIVALPRSTTPDHIEANIDLFDWELTDEDRQRLDDRDRNQPVYDTPARDWDSDVWGIPQ